MKKSNILLLVFFVCLPLVVIIYQWLLVRSYLDGSFFEPEGDRSFNVAMKHELLVPFHYVAIDGMLSAPSAAYITSDPNYPMRLPFAVAKADTFMIDIDDRCDSFVKRRVQNDTLFVNLLATSYVEMQWTKQVASIGAPGLKGIVLKNGGSYQVSGFTNADSLSITAAGCEVEISDLETPRLWLGMNAHSKVKLNNMPGVQSVGYRLDGMARLSLENEMARKLQPAAIDTSATIELLGNARELQHFINKNQ